MLADKFWYWWLHDYLTLQQCQKWLKPDRNFVAGDVVLILGEHNNCGQWPKGLIEETHLGPDGFVRSVQIRTASSSFVRDVCKLCLIEAAE